MPEDDISLRNLAEKCFAGFGKAEIIKMLSTIDYDYGLHHVGSLYLLVPLQFLYFPNIENILCGIAKNRILEPRIRGHAITILAGFLEYTDASFYHSLLQHENDSFVIEKLNWALEREVNEPELSFENEQQ